MSKTDASQTKDKEAADAGGGRKKRPWQTPVLILETADGTEGAKLSVPTEGVPMPSYGPPS